MWVDVEQNSEEWFNFRLGLATSSNFGKIMANFGKAFGNPAIEYAQKLALEIVTKERDETGPSGLWQFERGHEFEPVAIRRYELETLQTVTNGGFFHNLENTIGDSNDGNVGENGCIEVKTVVPNTQWKRIKKGGIDSNYKHQINGHLLVGEKEWCDFISFCPEMPHNKQILITRVYRDEEELKKLESRLDAFLELVKENVRILKS